MNRIQKKTNPVEGVAWGQVPTVTFQIGPRYRAVMFKITATGAAGKVVTLPDVLGDIVFKIGGNPQRTHSAVQLDQIHRSYGAQYGVNAYNFDGGVLHYTTGNNIPDAPVAAKATIFYVPVFFREPWRTSYAVRDMFAWPTMWPDKSVLPSFTAELTVPAISANIAAGSAITIECLTEVDNQLGSVDKATGKPIMLINRWERSGAVYGGSGDLVISTLPKKDMLSQISLFASYAAGHGPIAGATPAAQLADQNDLTQFDAILRAKVEVDNVTIRDVAKVESDQFLIDDDFNEAALPADRLDIVFDKSDRPDDGLPLQAGGNTVKQFDVTLSIGGQTAVGLPGGAVVAANKSVTVLRQSYGPIAGGS
jgi:hypothetical protein